jgi:hypothetical protein
MWDVEDRGLVRGRQERPPRALRLRERIGAFLMDVTARTRSPLPPEIVPLAGTVRRDALEFGPGSKERLPRDRCAWRVPRELAARPREAGKWAWLADLAGDVEDIRIARTKLAAFTVNVDGLSRLFPSSTLRRSRERLTRRWARAADRSAPHALHRLRHEVLPRLEGPRLHRDIGVVPSEAHALDVRTGGSPLDLQRARRPRGCRLRGPGAVQVPLVRWTGDPCVPLRAPASPRVAREGSSRSS